VSRARLVSVIVPTLDEERELPRVLDHLAALPGDWEVVVADGGSRDATLALARAHPRVDGVVEAGGGRAAQLNAGVAATAGDPIVFLHADSRLPFGAHAALRGAARQRGPVGGNFALRFRGTGAFPHALGAVYALQRRLGFYYGDSSVWARRASVAALGGFRALPIMDDYDFVRRLERLGPTACLPGPATTSARRWERAGVARTVFSWVVIRWLFVAGVEPARLAGLSRHVR
jgi:rSAM/selenodomain-associated transferase 2